MVLGLDILFRNATRYVYVHGPSWLGLWEGQQQVDICSSLTQVDAKQWQRIPDACNELVDRKVHASVLGLTLIGGLLLSWSCLQSFAQISVYYMTQGCRHVCQQGWRRNKEDGENTNINSTKDKTE